MKSPIVNLKNIVKHDYNYNESINTLRTNIQFCGNNIRTIMFTSALPDEGKSDVSFSLAYSLAQIGKKVLLIDADIRKSVLVSRYQPDHAVNGLSQYLSGQKKLEDVIYDTSGTEKFSVIFAGPYSPNPVVLLEEELFGQIFEIMEPLYDYIIVDTPPMGNLIDGAIVARHCDGAIMVIESGAISYRLEQKVENQLAMSGCRILGVVLNKVDLSQQGPYSKYAKYGKYGKYGSYGPYEYGPSKTGDKTEKGSSKEKHTDKKVKKDLETKNRSEKETV